jgi:hypothetical protein
MERTRKLEGNIMMKKISVPAREIDVIAQKDVVVAGGGPSGVMAAVAAARMGASTVLIERNGCLGGALNMFLPIQGFVDREERQMVKGLAWELVERLRAQKGAYHKYTKCPQTNNLLIIDPEIVKLVCQQMVLEAGVEIHFHSIFSEVHLEHGNPSAVIVENKSGRQALQGKFFIDATGDGDLAARSGAPFLVGRTADKSTQAATLTFRVDGVDEDAVRRAILADPQLFDMYEPMYAALRTDRKHSLVGCQNLIKKAISEGFPMPFGKVLTCSLMQDGAMLINMPHVGNVRCHEAKDLTRAEIETRNQVPIILEFLRRYMPGFERAELTATAPELGIRETRRIEGDYTLKMEDLRAGLRPKDTIGMCGYPVDIHSPDGKTVDLELVPAYGIPHRIMIPKGLDNVLVAGRSISATHEALSSVRVMAPCMAMGHAAGVAAALAVRQKKTSRQIDIAELQTLLKEQHAILE